jgi:GntR family transcriptional regulator of arabinose operon
MNKAALYKQIQSDLSNQIKLGKLKPGDRVPSEKELAESFNVSQITSKHALIGLAEEGLIYRIKGKGSFVSEQNDKEPNKNNGGLIGLIFPTMVMPVEIELFQYLENLIYQNGFQLLVKISHEKLEEEAAAIQKFLEIGARGLVLLPTINELYNEEILKLAIDRFPVVLVDRYLKNIQTSSVYSDGYNGTRMGVAYLIGRNHKKIALISPDSTNSATVDRREAFVATLMENNIPIDKSNWCIVSRQSILSGNEGDMVYNFFKSHPHVTACFCVDYHMTKLTCEAMERLGRKIGQDMEVVSFDPPGYPDICYLSQDTKAIAQNAFRILLNQIEDKSKVDSLVVPVQLNTAPPRRPTISFNESFYFRIL